MRETVWQMKGMWVSREACRIARVFRRDRYSRNQAWGDCREASRPELL